MPYGEPRAKLGREAVQVEIGAQPAMVSLLSFLETT
jgi:hypothetical protein